MVAIVYTALLCAVPGTSMFVGSVVAFYLLTHQSSKILSITQHFSAGILIAAIGAELIPKLADTSTGLLGTFCITLGFFGGVALMLGLESIMDEQEDEEGEKIGARGLLHESLQTSSSNDDSRGKRLWKSKVSKVVTKMKVIRALSPQVIKVRPIPWKVTIPIYIDSLVDGLLIGIVMVASAHAGYIMALATTIEMGFLGITFGATVKACGGKRWPVAALAPVFLVIGGLLGAACADALHSRSLWWHCGLRGVSIVVPCDARAAQRGSRQHGRRGLAAERVCLYRLLLDYPLRTHFSGRVSLRL